MSLEEVAEETLKAEASKRNSYLKGLWQGEEGVITRLHRHGIPAANAYPFTVGIEGQMWAKILDFDIESFYKSPRVHLETLLKMMLFQFKEIQDETPITRDLHLDLGAGFLEACFGMPRVFSKGTDPWVGREPLIKKPEDLSKMTIPDFYTSGIMPSAHQFFEEMVDIAKPLGFNVMFPRFHRGVYGIATMLRGFTGILLDLAKNPTFVKDLLAYVTEGRMEYSRKRAEVLGVSIEPSDLSNDEVDQAMISPEMYRKFILPHEKALCDFYGGIRYWHSCANVTKMLPAILEIPAIGVLDVGPWTDLRTALELTDGDQPIEVRHHPKKIDIYSATEDEMHEDIIDIVRTCKAHGCKTFAIRAGGLQTFHKTLDEDLACIKSWARVAHDQLQVLREGGDLRDKSSKQ